MGWFLLFIVLSHLCPRAVGNGWVECRGCNVGAVYSVGLALFGRLALATAVFVLIINFVFVLHN